MPVFDVVECINTPLFRYDENAKRDNNETEMLGQSSLSYGDFVFILHVYQSLLQPLFNIVLYPFLSMPYFKHKKS